MDLSQYKPSKGFIEIFGERPFRPDPGEALLTMRGRQVEYQQLIRDWDEVTPAEAPPAVADLLEQFAFGIGMGRVFTSAQRPGLFVRFDGNPVRRYDIHTLSGFGGVVRTIIDAQASYIEHVGSLPDERLYPGVPGLRAINEAKKAEEAAAMEAAE